MIYRVPVSDVVEGYARGSAMTMRAQDGLPITDAWTRFAELAEDVVAHHALEAEHGRLVLLDDAAKGLEDARTGKVMSEDAFREALRSRAADAR